jgi:hypothetical protein
MVLVTAALHRSGYATELERKPSTLRLDFVQWQATRNCRVPKGTLKRKDLQLALHALACRLAARGAIRSGTRYAKWAGGSRSQTHGRAAMGGFTQDDGYVQDVAPMHNAPRILANFCFVTGRWRCVPKTYRYRYCAKRESVVYWYSI